jgi:predicted nuclease of predicted toxin-antitoxin system
MRFLVDAQLPPALASWLTARGHEAQHVSDCGLERAHDVAIWDHAAATSAIIITKDEDFAALVARTEQPRPAVVWLRVGNTRRAQLLRWLEPVFPRILVDLERGEGLIEVE